MAVSDKGFLRHIQDLNAWNPGHFRPLLMADQRVGYLKDYMCEALAQWPEYFLISNDRVDVIAKLNTTDQRSRMLDEVVHRLVAQGVIAHYLGETYPVTGRGREQVLASLDRGAAAYFGIRTYGQHLNGYVETDQGVKLWIARRAAERIHFPGKLDNLVAGGLPQTLSLQDNLLKECQEEANIPRELVNSAKSTGVVSYCCETELGLKPDTLYCYDLLLPESFTPQNTDGEVAEFKLMDIDSVIQLVHDTDQFKPNCNLVILDFLIRHGFMQPEALHYLEVVSKLHADLTP